MFTVIAVLFAILAYIIGSINTSVLLSRHIYGEDVRDSGSGNAGATNMLRTYGKGVAILTLVCDILKGALPVLITYWFDIFFFSSFKTAAMSNFEQKYLFENLRYIVSVFIVLGHIFPIWFGFRGGKGVATSLGVILALDWRIGLIVLAIGLIIIIFSRYVSLGSVIAALVYPFIVLVYTLAEGKALSDNATYLIMAFLIALMVIVKHHANIKRLKHGTENKLFAKTEDTGEDEEDYEEDYKEDEEEQI